MPREREDWVCIRTRGQHFTADEIEFIAQACRDGRSRKDVARDLKCSIRVIDTHFARLRAPDEIAPAAKAKGPRPSRFYHSDFVPT